MSVGVMDTWMESVCSTYNSSPLIFIMRMTDASLNLQRRKYLSFWLTELKADRVEYKKKTTLKQIAEAKLPLQTSPCCDASKAALRCFCMILSVCVWESEVKDGEQGKDWMMVSIRVLNLRLCSAWAPWRLMKRGRLAENGWKRSLKLKNWAEVMKPVQFRCVHLTWLDCPHIIS